MKISTFLIIFLLFIQGCASIDGPKFSEMAEVVSDEYGTLIIYRVPAIKGAAWSHDYYIDGVHVAKLNSGGFTQLLVENGARLVSSGPRDNKEFVKTIVYFKSGETYYVEEHPGNTFATPTSFREAIGSDIKGSISDLRYQAPIVEKFLSGSDK